MQTFHIPGLEGLNQSLICISSGGDDIDWKDLDERRFYTNAFIVSGGKVGQISSISARLNQKTSQTAFTGIQEAWIWCTQVRTVQPPM